MDNELNLPSYTKKSWWKSVLTGFLVGLAIIVPGISGSTVMVIFKLYDQILGAVGNLFKSFKKCFLFLFPIGLGGVLGLGVGFLAVQKLIEIAPFSVVCLFAGLMIGAFPAVTDEVKGAQKSTKRILLFFLGLIVPVGVAICSLLLGLRTESGTALSTIGFLTLLACLPVGITMGATSVVPGLSTSAVLMAIGWFVPLVDSVHLSYWLENPVVFALYFALGISFLIGIFAVSKGLSFCLKKSHATTYFCILGLSLGSILTMFYNREIFGVYTTWAESGIQIFDLVGGIVLLLVGFICAYALVRYERKKTGTGRISD